MGFVEAGIARPGLFDSDGDFSFNGLFRPTVITFATWRPAELTALWSFEDRVGHISAPALAVPLDEDDLPDDVGSVVWQASDDDGATWRYHNGTSWVTATQPWHWNDEEELSGAIASFAFANSSEGRALRLRAKITPSSERAVEPETTFDIASSEADALLIRQIYPGTVTFELVATPAAAIAVAVAGTGPWTITATVDPAVHTVQDVVDAVAASAAANLIEAEVNAGDGSDMADTADGPTVLAAGATGPRGRTTPYLAGFGIAFDHRSKLEFDVRRTIGEYVRQNAKPVLEIKDKKSETSNTHEISTDEGRYRIDSVVRVYDVTDDPNKLTDLFVSMAAPTTLPPEHGNREREGYVLTLSAPVAVDHFIVIEYLPDFDVEIAQVDAFFEAGSSPIALVSASGYRRYEQNNHGIVESKRLSDRMIRTDTLQEFVMNVSVQFVSSDAVSDGKIASAAREFFGRMDSRIVSVETGQEFRVVQDDPLINDTSAVAFQSSSRLLSLRVYGCEYEEVPRVTRAIDTVNSSIQVID